jgi:hypothetical protein
MHLLGMQAGSLTSKAPLSKHHGNQGGGGALAGGCVQDSFGNITCDDLRTF